MKRPHPLESSGGESETSTQPGSSCGWRLFGRRMVAPFLVVKHGWKIMENPWKSCERWWFDGIDLWQRLMENRVLMRDSFQGDLHWVRGIYQIAIGLSLVWLVALLTCVLLSCDFHPRYHHLHLPDRSSDGHKPRDWPAMSSTMEDTLW